MEGDGYPVFSSILIIVCVGLMAETCHRQYLTTVREDYEGIVMDKWMGLSESTQGSRPYYKLLIEKSDGDRFRASVTEDEYQRCQVGMKITNVKGQLEFFKRPQESGVHRNGSN